jgi:fatty-acyl-CoA synthase
MRIDGAAIEDMSDLIWIADLPGHWAKKTPDKPAIIFEGRVATYADFDRGSAILCARWQAAGYRPGDRIGYFGRNNELFYYVYFACARGGYVLVPYNWRYAPPELAFALSDSSPRLVLHDPDFEDVVDAAFEGLEMPPKRILTESDDPASLRSILSDPAATPRPVERHFDDPFVQLYTSGTTGRPKGAIISHGAFSLFRNAYAATPQWEDWTADDVALSAMPNFHTAGIGFIMLAMTVGATVVHTADPSPASIIRLSNAHGVTRIYMVPTIIRMVLEELDATGGPAPRYEGVYYGAAPIGVLLDKAIATFGCRFTQYYGMTEAATTHVLGPADHDKSRPHLMRSVGKPLAGVSMEIRRPDMSVCAVREPGEIWIRSLMLMRGYANRPDATAEAVVDGWYRTGDGGYADEEGYLYLTDRLKEMIISGGENVYPVEVENALRMHPAVRDAAVVGSPDDKWGEAVTAVIEFKPGATTTFDELRSFSKTQLAGYKCPRLVYVTEALPRTPSGKAQRGVARATLGSFTLLGKVSP